MFDEKRKSDSCSSSEPNTRKTILQAMIAAHKAKASNRRFEGLMEEASRADIGKTLLEILKGLDKVGKVVEKEPN